MKHVSLLVILPCAAMAGNFSIAAVAGYGLPVPGAYIGENTTTDAQPTPDVESYEAVYGSYADGFRIGGEIGYALNDNVTLGLGIRYEKSSEYEFTNETEYSTSGRTQTVTRSVSGTAFIPSVVYSLPGEVYRPYMKVTGHFGMPTEIAKSEIVNSGTSTASDVSYEYERTGGIAWGFGGGLGVEYLISPAMSLLFEVVSESWTWEATDQKATKYEVDGEDRMEDLNVSFLETEYVESFTDDGTAAPDSPSKALRSLQANSAISMNIGLKFRF